MLPARAWNPPYSRQIRAERIIASARVVLAAFSLLAIWLDASEPGRYAAIAYSLLAAYVAYSAAIALAVWSVPRPLPRLGLATHALDLAIFGLIMFFTEGPTSPFFVYFVFALVSATLRWRWPGILWTALASLAVFIGLGVYSAEFLRDQAFALNRFIIRSVYLSVVAALLGYLGSFERRLRQELVLLAGWPERMPTETPALLAKVLAHGAAILGAPRLALCWEEPEEPWIHLASWSGDDLDWSREAPGAFGSLVDPGLGRTGFLCPDLRADRPVVLHSALGGYQRRRLERPLHPRLAERLGATGVLALPFQGEDLGGWLFALDKPDLTTDDLVLGEIVARQVAAHLEQLHLLRRLRDAAATEERVRLARDLHDGVIQSLTAAALQLRTAERSLETDPAAARERLGRIQELLADEQRQLRSFIQERQATPFASPAAPRDLAASLQGLCRRIEDGWGIAVDLRFELDGDEIAERVGREIHPIVHEALVNAARHGGAGRVEVALAADAGTLRISVRDDGTGFPFRGEYDWEALSTARLGPQSLMQRVAQLGGTLAIASREGGARLDIALPVG